MRRLVLGRVALAVVASVLAAGCAVDRSALKPAPASVARATDVAASRPYAVAPSAPSPRRVPTVPMTASQLAREMGFQLEDQSNHVLLSDRAMHVRIWKDSNEVSVAGRMARLPVRSRRQGASLIVPAQTVSYVQDAVDQERKRIHDYAAYEAKAVYASLPPLVLPEPEPAPLPTPTPAPRPATRVQPAPQARPGAVPDPTWTLHAHPARAWRWIVIHHSDDTSGNLAKYERIHVQNNGWDECGYHFVIGNGSLSGDGEIEVGSRWYKQKHGAHAKCDNGDNRYNERGIGICLVGDYEKGGRPTRAQMDSLVRLCRWLMATYGIRASDVIGHSDCKATCCPGKHFPWSELRRRL